jgi:hypothetical protein
MAARLSRWWRATFSYRGRILEERRLCAAEPIVVGPGGDVHFVVPGLDAPQVVASDGRVSLASGLRGLILEGDGEARELGPNESVTESALVRIWPTTHPDVQLELRAQSGVPLQRGAASLPTRELAYGLALAGCIVGLLAVQQHVAAIDAGGGAPELGRIERIMMTSATATFEGPPAPLLVQPDLVPPSQLGMEPVHVPLGERGRYVQPDKTAVYGTDSASNGAHSHSAPGQSEPGGLERGPAAQTGAFACDDPQASPKDNIDVVFVIDVSTTMSFMLRHLSQEISALDEVVRRHDAQPRYGLAVFVDDVMLVNEGKAYADIESLRRDFEHWAAFTSSNRQLRSDLLNLDWPENSLDALHAAATGFDWRPAEETLRLVVHATDDTFGEGGHWLSGGEVRHGYADTVRALQEAHVRVATFAARIGGRCECENVEAGFFAPYRGQPSIPDATGGAVFDIDEVASKRLRFATAVTALVDNTVCD